MAGKGKKNPNGSGSVSKRADGRYYAALTYPYYDPATGRTKRKRASTSRKDFQSAHEWLVQMQADLLSGKAVHPSDPLVSQFLTEWLSEVVEPSVAPATYQKRAYHVHSHLSGLAGKLKDLQPRQIHKLYTSMARDGYSLATRRDVHVSLKMALAQAVRWGMIRSNPVDHVDPPKANPSEVGEDEIRALTDEQAHTLFEATQSDRWHNYFRAAIRTGLRPGEALGLQWRDLELGSDPGSLRVRRALGFKPGPASEGGGLYLKAPKSAASRRTLVLHWEAVDAFRAQERMLVDEGLPVTGDAFVFPNTRGGPMNRHNLLFKYLRPALAKAGLPALTLHELRHTFVSIMMYEWRVPAEIVASMIGHADVSLTYKVYGHLAPDAQQQAIRALADLQKRPQNKHSGGA